MFFIRQEVSWQANYWQIKDATHRGSFANCWLLSDMLGNLNKQHECHTSKTNVITATCASRKQALSKCHYLTSWQWAIPQKIQTIISITVKPSNLANVSLSIPSRHLKNSNHSWPWH
jgi:hypothetical protein